MFAFGHGLSYTDFLYSDAVLDKNTMGADGKINVTAKVTNVGAVSGKEVVQLYISDEECSVERPVMELKGFKKVALEPGESKDVTFAIEPEMLKFYDAEKGEWTLEKGRFTVCIGSSSEDIRCKASFDYEEDR